MESTLTPLDYPEKTCGWCGEPSNKEFCDSNCRRAYLQDNEDDD